MKRLAIGLIIAIGAAGLVMLAAEHLKTETTTGETDGHSQHSTDHSGNGASADEAAAGSENGRTNGAEETDGSAHSHTEGTGDGTDHSGMEGGSGMHMEEGSGFQAVLAAAGEGLKAGQDSEITIRIQNDEGTPVTQFAITHEKLLHLIIVSEDLRDFRHIHPGYDGSGVFRVVTQFAAGGRYKWFADFVPSGSATVTRSGWLTVDGKPIYDAPALREDNSLIQQADGTQIELAIEGAKAGEEAVLTFRMRDAASGKEASGMENYLGAAGHVVILSSDMEQYLHVHPVDSKQAAGSEAKFSTTFPSSGLYKIWGQFQRDGRVLTVPFVVKIS